jgi:hypothetical protein
MHIYRLSLADADALRGSLDSAPTPNAKLRLLMRPAVTAWDATLLERIPDDIRKLVERLG